MSVWGAEPTPAQPPAVEAPVVPGAVAPGAPAGGPPAVVVRTPRWVVPVLIGSAAVTLAALAVAAAAFVREADPVLPFAAPALAEAHEECGSRGELSDGDRTLYLDMEGEEAGSGELTVVDLACYLGALEAPDYIIRHMESTRALDGRQSDTWSSFEASWTYHPDDGLDVLIRDVG